MTPRSMKRGLRILCACHLDRRDQLCLSSACRLDRRERSQAAGDTDLILSCLRGCNEIPILKCRPAAFISFSYFMTDQLVPHRRWGAVVKQDLHSRNSE